MKEEKSMKHWLKRKVTFTQALLVAFLITGGIGYAEIPSGSGKGLSIGTGSSTTHEKDVVIGKGAATKSQGGTGKITGGDIAIGADSEVLNYIDQGSSIAIGQKAKVENMIGNQEKIFLFGQTTVSGATPQDPSKMIGSIALGQNSYARTGSTMIGVHNYHGELGDTTVDSTKTKDYNVNVYATTIGTNSFNQGAFSNITGAYSIISGKYNGSNWSMFAAQNFGATISGSLNSIESSSSSSNISGIANTIVGVANRSSNANGSLIFGAGNEVTNSISDINPPVSLFGTNPSSPKVLADTLRKSIKDSNSAGSTLAIGGGNKADYTIASQLIGVNNTLTGENKKESRYALLNGYKNEAKHIENTYITGKENKAEDVINAIIYGNSNTVTKRYDVTRWSGKYWEQFKEARVKRTVSDIVLGSGNFVSRTGAYAKPIEAITVIGNNNQFDGVGSAILIGDNQKAGNADESVIIGSMDPEKKDKEGHGHKSVVIGNNAHSGNGKSVAVGYSSISEGFESTVTGYNSAIAPSNAYNSSIYGANNKIFGNDVTYNGVANEIFGTMNKIENTSNSMAFGAGNKINHAFGDTTNGLEGTFGQGTLTEMLFRTQYGEGYSDRIADLMRNFASTGGGAVLAMGNGNTSDYARRSQMIGTGNMLNGSKENLSAYNTMTGFQNTGSNVQNVSVIGTGNTLKDEAKTVVFGDHHELSGGKNNIILGIMETKEEIVDREYTPSLGVSPGNPSPIEGKPVPYVTKVLTPVKKHTENIKNAVMIGYNTDVQKDGGVALGSMSVSSTAENIYGYNPILNKAFQSDDEVAKLSKKSDVINQMNSELPTLESNYKSTQDNYKKKVDDYLEKSATYTKAYQTYHSYEHEKEDQTTGAARKKAMDDAKLAMDKAKEEMNSSKTSYTEAEKKYNSALATKNKILGTWKSGLAAVSVGDSSTGMTRQITNVAAGTEDTDAVNVAQLKNAQTHYYSAKDHGTHLGNYNNDGAMAENSVVAGIDSTSSGANSAVFGNHVKVTGVKNGRNNSIVVGHHIEADGTHNAIFATDYNNYDNKTTHVFGEANTVLGVGNLVGWTAEKDSSDATKWIYTKKGSGSDQNVAVGLTNTVNGGSVVVGTSSTSEDLGSSFGHGNKIIGMDNQGGQRGLALGNYLTVKGEEAIAIGTDSEATADWTIAVGKKSKAEKDMALALGYGSHSKVDGGIALGSFSIADRTGFGSMKKAPYSDFDLKGKTLGAVSIGGNGYLRQIINLADATEDTDAVNLRQLKALKTSIDTTVTQSKIHYYSVNDRNGSLKMLGNYDNDGAKGIASMAVGIGSSVRIKNGFQGATANVFGTLNTIDATGENTFDGVANSVVGVANTTKNANGVLVFGAGNLVKNAYGDVKLNLAALNPNDPESLTKALAEAVKESGGDILAMGGANEVDYAKFSQVVGVGNILKGASGKESKYASLNGYKNTATNVENTYVTGKENTVEEAEDNLVTGKNLSLKGEAGNKAKGNILFGFNDEKKDISMKHSAKNIVAIGNNIVANNDNSVYLGNNSTEATPDTSKTLDKYDMETIGEHIYKYQGSTPVGIVSVGKTGGERRIQNVAAGYVHQNSTDAINGSQLYATNSKLGTFMNSSRTLLGGNAEINKETGEVSMTDIGGTGKNTLHEAIAEVKKIAGEAAESFSSTSVSTEDELTVTKTETKDPTTQKVTNTDYKVGLSQAVKDKLNKIGDGVIAKDGEKSDHTVTGKTVYEYLEKQKEEFSVDLSNKANKDGSNIEVDKFTKKLNEGADIAAPKDRLVTDRQVKEYVAGTEIAYKAEGENESKKVKLSDGFTFQGDKNIQTKTEANGVIQHTLNSDLTGIKTISNEGTTIALNKEGVSVNNKKITGVADGEISATSQDAVNGKQLHATNGRVEKLEKDSTMMKEHMVENTRQIQGVKSEVKHVGALSSALAALHPMQYDPLQKNQVMAGVGSYRDKQAVAVGVTHYFNENLMMTAGVSIGEAERVKSMANIGITWKIGKDDDRKDLPERYKEGPIGSIYKMQQEMEEVLKENQTLKIEMKEQQKASKEQSEKIQKLEKQLEILLKNK